MTARDSKGRFVKKEVVEKIQKPLRDAKGRFVKKADAVADSIDKSIDGIFDDIKKAIDNIREMIKSFDK